MESLFSNIGLSTIIPYFVGIVLISLIDFITLVRARFGKHHRVEDNTPTSKAYSILIPIFGNMSYLKNVEFLKPYGSQVVLCTTTVESEEFNRAILQVSKKYGFQIFRSHVPLATSKARPNPWRLFRNTLHSDKVPVKVNKEIARDEIIRDSFDVVSTPYCIFLDGDTTAKENLDKLAGLIQEKDLDICSVRVLASKQNTMIEKLQSIEYELAMDARKIYPWLTSGACMVAKTKVIRDIMQHHSLFFSGGDIEIGKLAKMMKYRVGHIAFEFFTDVPETFKAWFKQRMAWFGGGFRHAIINLHQYTWRHPLFYFYTTFLVYLMTPLRWYEVLRHPQILVLIIILYWLLIALFHWRTLKWFYMLFPLYALMQVLVIVPLGVYTYCKMALHSQNVGLIKMRSKRVGG